MLVVCPMIGFVQAAPMAEVPQVKLAAPKSTPSADVVTLKSAALI